MARTEKITTEEDYNNYLEMLIEEEEIRKKYKKENPYRKSSKHGKRPTKILQNSKKM